MFKLLARFGRIYRKQAVVLGVVQVFQAIVVAGMPLAAANYLNAATVAGGVNARWWLFILIVITVLQLACGYLCVILGCYVSLNISRNLRDHAFSRTVRSSGSILDTRGDHNSLIVNTSDIRQIESFCLMLSSGLLSSPLMIIVGLSVALNRSLALSLPLIATASLFALIIIVTVRRARSSADKLHSANDGVSRLLANQLAGMESILAFSRSNDESASLSRRNTDANVAQFEITKRTLLLGPAVTAMISLGTVAVVAIAPALLAQSSVDVGTLVMFVQYFVLVLTNELALAFMTMALPRALIAGERVSVALEQEQYSHDEFKELNAPSDSTMIIVARGATFSFDDQVDSAIEDFDFNWKHRSTVAVVGRTGAGKSTLLKMIGGVLKPQSGSVAKCRCVQSYDCSCVVYGGGGSCYGYVPQRGGLFAGSIRSNFSLCAPGILDSDIDRALSTAACDFVLNRRSGLDTEIARGGSNLSGGERKRLLLALALARRPNILLLDDAFDQIDWKTSLVIWERITRSADCSIMFATQSSKLASKADTVIVLDKGRVAGIGRHEQLLVENEEYRKIVFPADPLGRDLC
ncbi:ABC transporter [Brevibacterium aurantiacum]|uniref:ABC transporter n=1 Tax=Brevibacterium aurantiacum TaxID=273384 RepID=A0A2H1K7D2_BREAU|nr:ABC transporter ATP-binding protein [Brevibacterium aurantiacum]SMX95640.1 ABC transporter [Brevibacterium aurantiacum]